TDGEFNTAIGYVALHSNDTSNYNTAIGMQAMFWNNGGEGNTAIGADAMHHNVGGDYNTATGFQALYIDSTGSYNTANGYYALRANKYGSSNTAIGSSSLYNNIDGEGNTAVGYQSLVSMTSDTFNTAIGLESGLNATGNRNVFLGYRAGYYSTGDDKLFIDNSVTATPLIWGDFANDSVKVHGTFNINDAFSFPTSDGTNGKTLLTDGAGQLSWGSPQINNLIDADSDTKIQVEENGDEDKIRFDLGGTEKWIMEGSRLEPNNSGFSVFIGDDAGLKDDLSGNENVNIGYKAGESNVTGELNVAVGARAMRNINGGTRNVAFGYLALGNATTGSGNTALGAFTLNDAGVGSNNTAVGRNAGLSNTGSNNVFVGYNTGFNNTGSNNLFLGSEAGFNELGGDLLYIENSASTTPLIWGDFANDSVKVHGTFNINDAFSFPTADGTNGNTLLTDGAGQLSWGSPAIAIISDADSDTQIQVEETADEDIIRFDIAGVEKWIMEDSRLEPTNNGFSVFIGQDAGLNDDLSDNQNVNVGLSAGKSNITGSSNAAVGAHAFQNNNGGTRNAAFGSSALGNATSGDSNTALGAFTLNAAGVGSNNTAVGKSAGFSNTGSGNVFLGHSAGEYELGSNKLYIENSDTATPLIWGDFSNNRAGINRVATTNTLEVGGDASKAVTGSWLANSDSRLKKNITYLNSEAILHKVLKMKAVNYEWNDDKTGMQRPEGVMYGFIAQDLEQVWPTKVKEDSQGYLQTAYGDYDPMFVEAIKALYAQNQELMQMMEVQNIKNESLKAEVVELSAMKDQISALSKRLERIEEVKALGYNE
ncbi:MAG: hypothetical protein ACI9FN_003448, partial [Saprospiraceae bacterium]